MVVVIFFFFSSRRRHTRLQGDWSSDVCSSDLRESTDAASLPNGARLYAYNVKWHTTTNKTPQEIHEIGLGEVKRIRDAMDKVMAAAGYKGRYEDFKKFLRTDPKFYFKDAASLLSAIRDIATP